MNRLLYRGCELYLHTFDSRWRKLRTQREELAEQYGHQPAGKVSVVVPVWNTRPEWLAALADSLHRQTLINWECILYDGGSSRLDTLRALEGLPGFDERLKVVHAKENLGIVGNTNGALTVTDGDWIAFCDHDDFLQPDALWRLLTAAVGQGADVVYSDEDRVTPGGHTHYAPHFKPDWCPENILACNYVCHMTLIRRDLMTRLEGLRGGLDGSQDHDLILRCMAAGAKVIHVPHILYHWRNNGGSMSHVQREKCLLSGQRAVQDCLDGMGKDVRTEIAGGRIRVKWPWPEEYRLRVLIRGGEPPAWLTDLLTAQRPDTIRWDMVPPCGAAPLIAEAEEELILLWDASLIPTDGMVQELASLACRAEVGCVFPRILDGHGRIASSGYGIREDGSLFCRGRGLKPDKCDPLLLEGSVHQVSCGDAGCVMFRRSLWQPMADQDSIGWMLKLRDRGLRHLVSPFAQAVSRGKRRLPEQRVGVPDGCLPQKMNDRR